jgi:Protein of unknown function (DUF4238)
MNPKRQHTIPILHLKHFVGVEPKGQVWTIDKNTGGMRSATPENTAVVSHFYSVEREDGTFDTTFESGLAEIEGAATPVYDRLIKGQAIPDGDKSDFAAFLAVMYLRTTAMRADAAELIGRHTQIMNYAHGVNKDAFTGLIKRFEKDTGRKLSEDEKKKFREALIDPTKFVFEIAKEKTLMVLGAIKELIPILQTMHWCIIRPKHGFFITSDNPVVRWVDPKTRHPIYGDHGFLNKTAEVTFPLSPRAVLFAAWRPVQKEFHLDRDHVLSMNKMRASHADRYLFAHVCSKTLKRLATDFKGSRPRRISEGFGPKKFAPIEVRRRRRR